MKHCTYRLIILILTSAASCLNTFGSAAWGIDSRFMLDPRTLDQRQGISATTDGAAPSKAPSGNVVAVPLQRATPAPVALQRAGNGKTLAKRVTPRKVMSRKTGQQFHLVRDDQTFLQAVRQFWPQLIPSQSYNEPRIDVDAQNYSLSLDPERFPVLASADGGKIIIDSGRNIPPLVKSLLLSQENKVRIIDENPGNRKYFFKALLSAAKFFSVEENYSVAFGNDPQLIVTADYRIEKNQESLFNHELTLLNVRDGHFQMPPALTSFLGNEGFQILEPFAEQYPSSASQGELVQLLGSDFKKIADGFMRALNIDFEKDRRIELFNFRETGIALQVRVDRYFEKAGERFAVSLFEGDPVSYTLTRLLETRGYRVIILESRDGLPRIADKFLARLRLPGKYYKQELWQSGEHPYSVELSGLMFRQKEPGKGLFITDRELDPLFVDLVTINGFRVITF